MMIEPIRLKDILSEKEYQIVLFQAQLPLLRESLHLSTDYMAYKLGITPEQYANVESWDVCNKLNEHQYDMITEVLEEANEKAPSDVFTMAYNLCGIELEYPIEERELLGAAISAAIAGHKGMLRRIYGKCTEEEALCPIRN